jgi:hypothetical protein
MKEINTKEWRDGIVESLRNRHAATLSKIEKDTGRKAEPSLVVMPAEVTADKGDPMLFTARITKRVLDRDGEVVLPSGGQFADFDKSGAIYWNHDYDRPVAVPVGKLAKTDEHIEAKARFIARVEGQQGDFLPDYARAFVKAMGEAGRSAGVSIGFVPLEERQPTEKDVKEYGEHVRNVITKWKLLEWSIAPVQANQDAYVTAVGKSIGDKACKALFGRTPKLVIMEPDPPKSAPKPVKRHVIIIEPPKAKRKAAPRVDVAREVRLSLARQKGLLYA